MLPYRSMMQPYNSSALEAELAYRREVLMASYGGARTRRTSRMRAHRRAH
jgi:hypothetical protein